MADKQATVWAAPRSVFIPPALIPPPKVTKKQAGAVSSLDKQYDTALGRPVRAHLKQQAPNVADAVPRDPTHDEWKRAQTILLGHGRHLTGDPQKDVALASDLLGSSLYVHPEQAVSFTEGVGKVGRAAGHAADVVGKAVGVRGVAVGRQGPYLPEQRAAQESIVDTLAGKAAGNLLFHGETSHLIGAGAELATLAPIARPFKGALALAAAAKAVPEGRAAAMAAFHATMEAPSLTERVVQNAKRASVLKSPERGELHAAVDAMIPDKRIAQETKAQFDGHIHQAVRGLPRAERKAAAAQMYAQEREQLQAIRAEAAAAPPVYEKQVLHVTTPQSATGIRAAGFDINRGKGIGGDHYGPGIYLADYQRDMGSFWRNQLETINETGKVATESMSGNVALHNPFHYQYIKYNRVGDKLGRITPREALEEQRPDLVAKFDKAAKTMSEKKAFGKTLREAGYDGLVVEHQAGDEIVAFHPDTVTFDSPPAPHESQGILFHGSPEGQFDNVNALHHTKMWREGPGFYLTSDAAKASKYAAGKTASAARKTGEGAVGAFRLKPDAVVLNMDTQPESFWRTIASEVTGEPVSEATWKEWANDIEAGKMSEGVANRARLLHLLTGWAEMPKTDAYYAIEEALHNRGIQATLHHESGVPVYVVKDESALDPVVKWTPETHSMLGQIPPEQQAQIHPDEVPRLEQAQSFLDQVVALVASEEGSLAPGGFERMSAGSARTLTLNELTQQIPQARSVIWNTAERQIIDAASKQLEKLPLLERSYLQAWTVSGRVAKYAGRLGQRTEMERAKGLHAGDLRAIGKVKEASDEDIANFYYGALPATHRNAEGLQLIHDKQQDYLRYLGSGEAHTDLEASIRGERARQAELRHAIDESTDEEEQSALTSEMFRSMKRVDTLQTLQIDVHYQIGDVSASLAVLQRLIEKSPAVNEAALNAVRNLMRAREQILVDNGLIDPEQATSRVNAVADWLGLEPTGDEMFLGHRLPRGEQFPGPGNQIPMGVARVASPKGVGSHNQLLLITQGRLRPSLRVAAEDWNSALVYKQALRARDDLAAMGYDYAGGAIPKGHALVNKKGTTIPVAWKHDELQQFSDGNADVEQLRSMAKEIASGWYAEDARDMAAMAANNFNKDLRVVPTRLVKRYYAQFRTTGSSSEARAFDTVVDAVATSIVFARVGYIPKNVLQNIIMTVPHQGPMFLVNAVRAAQLVADPELAGIVLAEVGSHGAARSLDSTGKFHTVTNSIKDFVGAVADDRFRVAAFVHELAAEGVLPKFRPVLNEQDKAHLLQWMKNPANREKLNDINFRANQAMADFSRMTPDQMRKARRILIVPGWLMAGTQYPFRFAAHHPIRTALIAYVAMGDPGAPKELRFKPLWTHLHGEKWLEGINTPWGRFRTNSISPVSTPIDLARGIAHIGTASMWDSANPLARTVFDFASGTIRSLSGDSYSAGYGKIAKHDLPRLVPSETLVQNLISPPSEPYYPEDATRLGRLKREVGVLPIQVPGDGSGGSGRRKRPNRPRRPSRPRRP